MRPALLAALLAVSTAGAAGAEDSMQKLHFDRKGAASASGEVRPGHGRSYTLKGKRGEALRVSFQPHEGTCGFAIYQPGMAVAMWRSVPMASEFSGHLPADGEYRIGVSVPDGGHGRCSYDLHVTAAGG